MLRCTPILIAEILNEGALVLGAKFIELAANPNLAPPNGAVTRLVEVGLF
jgi:hypothetical protein